MIVDLAENQLGAAGNGIILIDIDGAGAGWFIDDTPDDDAEFAASSVLRPAVISQFDLLSVIRHEMGHIIGMSHADDSAHLMSSTLKPGHRSALNVDELFADEHFDLLAPTLQPDAR